MARGLAPLRRHRGRHCSEKCKGHATVADVEKGVATDFLRTGNSHADHFAGRGAQLEEQQCPSEAALEEYNDAKQWYWWLAALTEHWPADTQFREEGQEDEEAVAATFGRPCKAFTLHPDKPQNLRTLGEHLRCQVCQRRAKHAEHSRRKPVRVS